jgi:short-subunit dehydrogenase
MMSTKNGTALITGASSGIGALYADRLAHRGHDLILVARDEQRLAALADRLKGETGVAVRIVKADLVEPADRRRVEQILNDDSKITVLVNNAGIASTGPLLASDPDQLERMIQLNIVAVTRLGDAAAKAFAARKAGLIINIGSVTALIPESFNGVYSGTKAFVLNYSQALQVELKPHGVRVQAVLPGATRTEIWERAGRSLESLPAEILMDADEMVDAAIAGLDQGELVTIPSLPDAADWDAFTAARLKLAPNLSRNAAAGRYKA